MTTNKTAAIMINPKHYAGLALALVTALMNQSNTDAATLTITSTADSGTGSLRAALATATNGDTIDATGVSGMILLTSGELLVSNSVTILGPGPAILTVNGNAASRAFHVINGVTAVISGLTITNGIGTTGGGIWNDHSTLTVSNCTASGNSAGFGGGGICNDHSTLTVADCTLSGNSAPGTFGGGIFNYDVNGGRGATVTLISSTISSNSAYDGGGIFNNAESSGTGIVNVTTCTLSGNSAPGLGGGICNDGSGGIATLAVNASTFSANSSGSGGGILNDGSGATLAVGDTILTAGGAGGGNLYNISGTVNSLGYNLCSDSGAGFLTNATDKVNTDPVLGPLQDNGGPTPTMTLLPGSPAIDQGKSFGPTTDQRGAPRPFDFPNITNASGGDGSDIGAFELGSPKLNIQQFGSSAVLSWPSYYGGFSLQSTTNLAASGSWVTAGGTMFLAGNQYLQTNGPIAANRLFRLSNQ